MQPNHLELEFPQDPLDNLYRVWISLLQWKPLQPEVVASIQDKYLMNSKAVHDIT